MVVASINKACLLDLAKIEPTHTETLMICNLHQQRFIANYTTNALTVDIAAIKLESSILVNIIKQSPPLCIGNARKGKKLFFSKRNVEIFGWGKVGKVVDEDATLQSSGNIVIDDIKECIKAFKKERVKDHSKRGIMCTVANTTPACTGNYGSAVVARNKISCTSVQL